MTRTLEYDFKVKLPEESIQTWLNVQRQFSCGKQILEESAALGKARNLSKKIKGAQIFSYKDITQEHLDVLLHNFLEPPYQSPDLKAQVEITWQRRVDETHLVYSVLITANPKTNQVVVSGRKVKVLDHNVWKSRESLGEVLESAFTHPYIVKRQNESFQDIHPSARLGPQR